MISYTPSPTRSACTECPAMNTSQAVLNAHLAMSIIHQPSTNTVKAYTKLPAALSKAPHSTYSRVSHTPYYVGARLRPRRACNAPKRAQDPRNLLWWVPRYKCKQKPNKPACVIKRLTTSLWPGLRPGPPTMHAAPRDIPAPKRNCEAHGRYLRKITASLPGAASGQAFHFIHNTQALC